MNTPIRHLLNEYRRRRGFMDWTWDTIKSILSTAALGGIAHWGATKMFPKYAALSKGVGDTMIKPGLKAGIGGMMKTGADELLPDLLDQLEKNPGDQALKDKISKLQSIEESKNMNENTNIKQFIKQLGEKNYSGADKYLKQVVEDKLKSKITSQYKKQTLY
jgi:hypothetical protein